MSYRFLPGLVLAAAAFVLPGCSSTPTAPAEDYTKELQGTWHPVDPTKKESAAILKFENDVFHFIEQGGAASTQGGQTKIGGALGPRGEQGTFSVNGGLNPRGLDVAVTTGPNQGKLRSGIYTLEGKHLKVCLGGYGKPRPTEFVASADTTLLYLENRPTSVGP